MPTDETQPGTGRLSRYEAEEYLANLQVLTSEVNRGMKALVARDISSLRDSIILQRETCERLSFLGEGKGSPANHRSGNLVRKVDPDLAREIRGAADALLILNKNYSALLRHSEDTLRLFAGLFRGFDGTVAIASTGQIKHQTWSCEL